MLNDENTTNDNDPIREIDTLIVHSKKNIISSIFNLVAKKNYDSKIERCLEFATDVIKIIPLVKNHIDLKKQRKKLSLFPRFDEAQAHKAIRQWYADNPEHRAVASPEFRRPHYPDLKEF